MERYGTKIMLSQRELSPVREQLSDSSMEHDKNLEPVRPDLEEVSAIYHEDDRRVQDVRAAIAVQDSELIRIQERHKNDPIVRQEQQIVEQDSVLYEKYRSIVELGNEDALREKSIQQLNALLRHYMADVPFWNIKKKRERKKKLEQFQLFVSTLEVVRADKHSVPAYKSPSETGHVSSYGPYDILTHSEEFVYASFGTIGHYMSQGEHQRKLAFDTSKAQIVMNDIANVAARTPRGESFMKKYINNIFDFETGKDILAVYFAHVFETPEQAVSLLSRAGGNPHIAQRWDEYESLQYVSPGTSTSQEAFQKKQQQDAELTNLFVGRMKSLLATTGVEPPLSIEVRIKGAAEQIQ